MRGEAAINIMRNYFRTCDYRAPTPLNRVSPIRDTALNSKTSLEESSADETRRLSADASNVRAKELRGRFPSRFIECRVN